MKILYINHYAGSPNYGMAFRPYYLAKEWVKLGHEVTIIGADNSHLRNIQPNIQKDLTTEKIEDINYLWIKTPKYSSSGIRRIFNIVTFVLKLLKYRSRIYKQTNPDVVIASSTYPLDIYPAYYIAKKNKAKLVFELHDMWPLSPMVIGGYSKLHPFIIAIQLAENFACKKSDLYISLLGNAKDYLVEHGLKEENFVHIPNGYDLEEYKNNSTSIPKEHEQLISRLRKEKYTIVGYAGGHAPSNALLSYVQAIKSFSTSDKVAFLLVGNGPQKEAIVELANKNEQKNVFFLPAINKTSIPNLLDKFDILYAGGVSSILHSYGTSFNKITDYMLAGKPIIFAVDEPNSLVEKVGCGFQISAENGSELTETIKLLIEMPEKEREEMGKKGHEYAINKLTYSSLAKQFITALTNC